MFAMIPAPAILFYLVGVLLAYSAFGRKGELSSKTSQKIASWMVCAQGYRYEEIVCCGDHLPTTVQLSVESPCFALMSFSVWMWSLVACIVWDVFSNRSIEPIDLRDSSDVSMSPLEQQQQVTIGSILIAGGAVLLVSTLPLVCLQAFFGLFDDKSRTRQSDDPFLPSGMCSGCSTVSASVVVGAIVLMLATGSCLHSVDSGTPFGTGPQDCALPSLRAVAWTLAAAELYKTGGRILAVALWLCGVVSMKEDSKCCSAWQVCCQLTQCSDLRAAVSPALLVLHAIFAILFVYVAIATGDLDESEFVLGRTGFRK